MGEDQHKLRTGVLKDLEKIKRAAVETKRQFDLRESLGLQDRLERSMLRLFFSGELKIGHLLLYTKAITCFPGL
jgi:hypothetical protein